MLQKFKSPSPMLAQTSRPPARNLFVKAYDAGGVGATDDVVDDGIRDGGNCAIGSVMKPSAATVLGRGR